MKRVDIERKAREAIIIKLARDQHEREGTCEIDSGAKISEVPLDVDGDNGAYVQAWVWVDFADTPLDKEAGNE
jgi:hypothetical protein